MAKINYRGFAAGPANKYLDHGELEPNSEENDSFIFWTFRQSREEWLGFPVDDSWYRVECWYDTETGEITDFE